MAELATIARPYAEALFKADGAGNPRDLADQVAALAVKGAEQILRKEVNPAVHSDLLGRLKAEL